MKIVRAISIRQPFVEQILRGDKKWEYRSQNTNIRVRVYLYASKRPGAKKDWESITSEPCDLQVGKIVGTVEITTSRRLQDGSFAYTVENPKRLKPPRLPTNQPQPRSGGRSFND
jgi:hypothetical protein